MFMTWATKRQFQYLSGLFGFIIIILFIFLYPVIFKKPTCFDNKKNGTEIGIDCGGSCQIMCKENVSDPVILWSRAFPVLGNNYNLVAFIENQNKNSGVENVSYEFIMYDINNRLIGHRQGSSYIPPNKQFVIFEPSFNSGEAKLKNITFQFVGQLNWVKKDANLNNLALFVDNITLGEDRKSPNLSARIKNESIYDLPSFEVIAILYDENHNAINASKTVKDGLASNDKTLVYFTWPEAFTSEPFIKDVLVEINPFKFSF